MCGDNMSLWLGIVDVFVDVPLRSMPLRLGLVDVFVDVPLRTSAERSHVHLQK